MAKKTNATEGKPLLIIFRKGKELRVRSQVTDVSELTEVYGFMQGVLLPFLQKQMEELSSVVSWRQK